MNQTDVKRLALEAAGFRYDPAITPVPWEETRMAELLTNFARIVRADATNAAVTACASAPAWCRDRQHYIHAIQEQA